ncbi:hypothetical protein ACFPWP_07190 [Kribbella jiaozuonensis]
MLRPSCLHLPPGLPRPTRRRTLRRPPHLPTLRLPRLRLAEGWLLRTGLSRRALARLRLPGLRLLRTGLCRWALARLRLPGLWLSEGWLLGAGLCWWALAWLRLPGMGRTSVSWTRLTRPRRLPARAWLTWLTWLTCGLGVAGWGGVLWAGVLWVGLLGSWLLGRLDAPHLAARLRLAG